MMLVFTRVFKSTLLQITLFALLSSTVNAQSINKIPGTNTEKLMQMALEYQVEYDSLKKIALVRAQAMDIPVRFEDEDGVTYELMYFEGDEPVYNVTNNIVAAISTSTQKVWPGGSAGLNLAGQGMTLGEWDGGAVRVTHQEYVGRVIQVDGSTSLSSHATHVAGTMIASGVDSLSRGMAYLANLRAFDWNNDNSEMANEAANGLLVSNHSYGQIAGWRFGNFSSAHNSNQWYWYGTPSISQTIDWKFGFYNTKARQWDQIAEAAPFYLIVKSAGNNRGQGINSGFHWVNNGSGWDSSFVQRERSGGSQGFDCIPTYGNAKNILTLGAVNDVPNGYFQPSNVVMSSFSSYGPTDDGRIKPDVVGNGVSLRSSTSASNTSYGNSSGTSMSAPNVSGSLILLQQHYDNLYDGFMRAATLKALVIHTADECGTFDGPDYRFGWGLMNTQKAALLISDSLSSEIHESTLANQATNSFNLFADGTQPVKVTLSWTDPAATVGVNALNNTTSKLVNDLDVRIINLNDTSFEAKPWILNPAQPAAAATKGDNFRDNVEVIDAGILPLGNYQVVVTHKGTLSGGNQAFSLIITGKSNVNCTNNFTVNLQAADSIFCKGANTGKLVATVSGGVPPYTFQWNNFPNVTGDTLSQLAAGTYQVTVTDSVFCSQTFNFTLVEPNQIALTSTQIQSPTCAGDSNGGITVSASGGVGNLTYTWNTTPSVSGPSISNLSPGLYTVTVTDENLCQENFTINLTGPNPMGIQIGQVKDASCQGVNDGEIALLGFGGAQPYTYTWLGNPSLSGNILNNLSPGTYTLVLSDANGCTDTSTYTIGEPNTWILDTISGAQTTGIGQTETYAGPSKSGASYQWTVTGGNIVGSANNANVSVNWNQIGMQTLEVQVKTNDSCGYSDKIVDVNEFFSIAENTLSELKLFPNPNGGSFTIDLGRIFTTAQVEIYTVRGQKIYSNTFVNERSIPIDLQIAAGIYMVKVQAEGEEKIVRWVLQ